ncbi:hypothetical protein ABW19_dt0208984 [Dactylella cylindrospora]|nr:hypothetical protein ABW19_dt0208984 [Dactylella cylindrospora]
MKLFTAENPFMAAAAARCFTDEAPGSWIEPPEAAMMPPPPPPTMETYSHLSRVSLDSRYDSSQTTPIAGSSGESIRAYTIVGANSDPHSTPKGHGTQLDADSIWSGSTKFRSSSVRIPSGLTVSPMESSPAAYLVRHDQTNSGFIITPSGGPFPGFSPSESLSSMPSRDPDYNPAVDPQDIPSSQQPLYPPSEHQYSAEQVYRPKSPQGRLNDGFYQNDPESLHCILEGTQGYRRISPDREYHQGQSTPYYELADHWDCQSWPGIETISPPRPNAHLFYPPPFVLGASGSVPVFYDDSLTCLPGNPTDIIAYLNSFCRRMALSELKQSRISDTLTVTDYRSNHLDDCVFQMCDALNSKPLCGIDGKILYQNIYDKVNGLRVPTLSYLQDWDYEIKQASEHLRQAMSLAYGSIMNRNRVVVVWQAIVIYRDDWANQLFGGCNDHNWEVSQHLLEGLKDYHAFNREMQRSLRLVEDDLIMIGRLENSINCLRESVLKAKDKFRLVVDMYNI